MTRYILLAGLQLLAAPASAQDFAEQRRLWNEPQPPVQIAENTWYVGTAGLSAILIRGAEGAVLIDGALPESAPQILANLAAIGLAANEVRLLLNSHAHVDHAGGLAALQQASGARLFASPDSAVLLARGGLDDAHFGDAFPYPPVQADALLVNGQQLQLGEIVLTAHFTPGHTPGSTSWSWQDRIDGQTVSIVYADSLTAPGYRLLGNSRAPQIVEQFRTSFARLNALPCRVLIGPHPEFFDMAGKLAAAAAGDLQAFATGPDCATYTQRAATRLDAQLREQAGGD